MRRAWYRCRVPGGIELTFTHAAQGLIVVCDFRVADDGRQVLGTISIRSRGKRRFDAVRFPVVTLGMPFSGMGEQDRLLWPECDGTVLSDPLRHNPDRKFKYPGSASIQMMAAFDGQAGLYLAAYDREANEKNFLSRRLGSGLQLAIGHTASQESKERWDVGYEIALSALRPAAGLPKLTWQSAAELYRAWAVKQPWCAATMAERVRAGDIPSWIAEPQLILTYALRGKIGADTWGSRAARVAPQVEQWRRFAGVPITCLLTSWEKVDSWAPPDYFPPYGGESAFREVNRQLHAQGDRSMTFLSGLRWTLRKELADRNQPPVSVDQRASFEGEGRPFAVTDSRGAPILSGRFDQSIGQYATICPTTPLARKLIREAAMQSQALGVNLVQADQINGGGLDVTCLSEKHGHPPGGGNWCSRALYHLFDETRRAGKLRDPNFAFSIEEPGEYYLPVLDTYHSRDLHQGRYPRSGAGVVGVPLFTFIYHDYLAGYGSEGYYVSESPSDLALYQIGMNLVCGKVPGVAMWSRDIAAPQVDQTQRRLLRAHLDLLQGQAGEFLTFGQMLPAEDLLVETKSLLLSDKGGARSIQIPVVLHSRWKLPDGRIGVVLACIDTKRASFGMAGRKIEMEPGEVRFELLSSGSKP